MSARHWEQVGRWWMSLETDSAGVVWLRLKNTHGATIGKREATGGCGCRLVRDDAENGGDPSWYACPLHARAGRLLELLTLAMPYVETAAEEAPGNGYKRSPVQRLARDIYKAVQNGE